MGSTLNVGSHYSRMYCIEKKYILLHCIIDNIDLLIPIIIIAQFCHAESDGFSYLYSMYSGFMVKSGIALVEDARKNILLNICETLSTSYLYISQF